MFKRRARARAYRRLVVLERVIVNLKTGTAIEGVVVQQTGPLLVIRHAIVHQAGGEHAPADGTVLVEIGDVDFVQTMPREAS